MKQKRTIHFSETELEHLHSIIHLLQQEMKQAFTVKQLCTLAEMNRLKLNAGFQLLTGYSIYKYVLECRLKRACELLLQTALPVKVVAIECGFKSVKHFITFFKKRMGVAPGVYRLQMR